MKDAPRGSKKAVPPAKAARTKKAGKKKVGKAKTARTPVARKPAAAKRASGSARPAVQKPVQKPVQKVEAKPEAKPAPVEKHPFWGFLGIGKKQKAKVSIMDLQGKK